MDEALIADEFARWWRETGEHELRQVLFWRWDPIGVSDYFPNTADEYDGYAPQLVQLLREGGGPEEVAAHLGGLERGPIGFADSSPERLRELGELIHDWYGNSQGSWAEFGPVRR